MKVQPLFEILKDQTLHLPIFYITFIGDYSNENDALHILFYHQSKTSIYLVYSGNHLSSSLSVFHSISGVMFLLTF